MTGKNTTCSPARLLARVAIAAALVSGWATAHLAQAQTYNVIHSFTGGSDGGGPLGVAIDRAGNLYGAASYGGSSSAGVIFKLKQSGSSWVLSPLYSFEAGTDGFDPTGVTIALDGTLYGTARSGGLGCSGYGCGVVFRLRPGAHANAAIIAPWQETILYRFSGEGDGANPNGNLVFDRAGSGYGTTVSGGETTGSCSALGAGGCGVVFELTPGTTGWTFTNLYSFSGSPDGNSPTSGVIYDRVGNLYGTTGRGGTDSQDCIAGCGTVYELALSGPGQWSESTLYSFQNGTDGNYPIGLIFDSTGNLYGPASQGGTGRGGTVYELSPSGNSWTFNVLYSLVGGGGEGPAAGLTMDAAGNIYGTMLNDGAHGYGSVFKLQQQSNGTWKYSSLHDFTGGSDGANPQAQLILDAQGNIFGSAWAGGMPGSGCSPGGCGVVFRITP